MASTAILQLQPRRTVLRTQGTDGAVVLAVSLGWEDLAALFDAPISEGAIEAAIERVEDALGHPRLDIAPMLQVHGDETLGRLAKAAGLSSGPDAAFSAQSIEALFTRLAAQAAGALAQADRLPGDARFAATLVIVRELMHHLGLSGLQLDAGTHLT
jgi:hypothetical protein